MSNYCKHDELEFVGEEKGDRANNRYFKCAKCGAALILTEDKKLFEIFSQAKRPNEKTQ